MLRTWLSAYCISQLSDSIQKSLVRKHIVDLTGCHCFFIGQKYRKILLSQSIKRMSLIFLLSFVQYCKKPGSCFILCMLWTELGPKSDLKAWFSTHLRDNIFYLTFIRKRVQKLTLRTSTSSKYTNFPFSGGLGFHSAAYCSHLSKCWNQLNKITSVVISSIFWFNDHFAGTPVSILQCPSRSVGISSSALPAPIMDH